MINVFKLYSRVLLICFLIHENHFTYLNLGRQNLLPSTLHTIKIRLLQPITKSSTLVAYSSRTRKKPGLETTERQTERESQS